LAHLKLHGRKPHVHLLLLLLLLPCILACALCRKSGLPVAYELP
jgi:hypothetical protein